MTGANVQPGVGNEGVNRTSARPVPPPSAHAPPVGLPLRFFGVGLLSVVGLPVGLLLRPEVLATYHYNQFVIALTHLTVLGWMGSVVFGALYQLVPVVLGTRLYSQRLAHWHFVCHLVGFAGMVWMFWRWDPKQVGHFGSVLALGVGLCVWNLVRTVLRAPRRTWMSVVVLSSLLWWGAVVTVGLGVAAAKCTYESAARLDPTTPLGALVHALESTATYLRRFDPIALMHAHAHLGLVGAFLILLVGVSYQLVPMFTLGPAPSPRRVLGVWALLNLATAGSFLTILHRSPWKLCFTGIGLVALAGYGWDLAQMLRRRKRPELDFAMRYFLTGLAWLIPLGGLALYLSWPGLVLTARVGQWENVYGLWALTGLFTFCLLGMLYKIVPFLAWYRWYAPWVGLRPVPALHELYRGGWLRTGYGLHMAAVLGWTLGALASHTPWVRAGALLFAAAMVLHAVNLGWVWVRRAEPAERAAGVPEPRWRSAS